MKSRLIFSGQSIDLTPRLLEKNILSLSKYLYRIELSDSDSLFESFYKLLVRLSIKRIRNGLTVRNVDSRPGLFTNRIYLGHCVMFYSRKLSLALSLPRRGHPDGISWDIQ